ncbi:hypothetical protein [Rubrobacter indicoceani]|uniref:hypothetical protein n=1 Tax=Rubrobacter indicoceani TaxID=2051957 RepID=UPI000E5B30DC|nr:hypothetical protein [Rubrobacter indicoceani]
MKSVAAVGLGILIATVIGFLLVFGALAPVLSVVFGLGTVSPAGLLPSLLLVLSIGFAFYFGGMAASYYAGRRRRLHGTLVGIIPCVISPLVNVLSGNGPFPNVDSGGLVVVLLLALLAAVGASYIGSKRGEALYAFNSSFPAPKAQKSKGRRLREQARKERESGQSAPEDKD